MFPIRSLDVLLCSPKLDRELVKLLKATFPDLYQNNDEREDEEEEEEEVQLVIAADDDVTDDIIDSSQCLSFSFFGSLALSCLFFHCRRLLVKCF